MTEIREPDWAALYGQHRHAMHQAALSVLAAAGCPDLAEDAVHDAIVSLIKRSDRCDSYHQGLFTVAARRAAINTVRHPEISRRADVAIDDIEIECDDDGGIVRDSSAAPAGCRDPRDRDIRACTSTGSPGHHGSNRSNRVPQDGSASRKCDSDVRRTTLRTGRPAPNCTNRRNRVANEGTRSVHCNARTHHDDDADETRLRRAARTRVLLARLPAVQRRVITYTIIERGLAKDLATELGVSPARVSQIRRAAMYRLRSGYASSSSEVAAVWRGDAIDEHSFRCTKS